MERLSFFISRKSATILSAVAISSSLSACTDSQESNLCSTELSLDSDQTVTSARADDPYSVEYNYPSDQITIVIDGTRAKVSRDDLPENISVGGNLLRLQEEIDEDSEVSSGSRSKKSSELSVSCINWQS